VPALARADVPVLYPPGDRLTPARESWAAGSGDVVLAKDGEGIGIDIDACPAGATVLRAEHADREWRARGHSLRGTSNGNGILHLRLGQDVGELRT
jgi:hypothetical protein